MADEPKLGPVARRLAATQRVLCVEDEPDIAAFLRAYFRAVGYDFVHLDPTDPDEVLRTLEHDQPSPISCCSTSASAGSPASRPTAACGPTSAGRSRR